MQKTTYYELNKPETTDTYNIANENDNMDIIDTQLHTNAENISTLNENKLAKTGDSKDTTTTFTSSDVADGSATAWTSVTKLDSGEKHSSIFAKVSQMFKNVRYLYKLLGTTDVSSFFGGSNQDITGALSTLNNHIGSHTVAKNVPSDAVFTDHTYNGSNLNTSTSKTGSGTTVTDTIASGTSMNSAIGTLLNNDAALNSALNDAFQHASYVNFPSGLKMCWGTLGGWDSTDKNYRYSDLPITFTAIPIVFCTPYGLAAQSENYYYTYTYYHAESTNNKIKVVPYWTSKADPSNYGKSDDSFFYLAIGY